MSPELVDLFQTVATQPPGKINRHISGLIEIASFGSQHLTLIDPEQIWGPSLI